MTRGASARRGVRDLPVSDQTFDFCELEPSPLHVVTRSTRCAAPGSREPLPLGGSSELGVTWRGTSPGPPTQATPRDNARSSVPRTGETSTRGTEKPEGRQQLLLATERQTGEHEEGDHLVSSQLLPSVEQQSEKMSFVRGLSKNFDTSLLRPKERGGSAVSHTQHMHVVPRTRTGRETRRRTGRHWGNRTRGRG